MSIEAGPDPVRSFGRVAAVVAVVVVAGVVVIGGGSYLGRLVGASIGDDTDAGGPGVEPGLEVTVEVPAGSTAKEIAAILAARGVVRSAVEFEVAVRSADAASNLKAGTYQLETLMDPGEVVAVLITGPVADIFRVTVPEGLRVGEILDRLAAASDHSRTQFEAALLEGEVSTSLREMPSSPQLSDWEGLLFPDTYEFARTATPASVLQRLATTMEQRVAGIDWDEFRDAGWSIYDGIILASLIESEVRIDEERPIVSSVIHNRLEIGMKLDIDATILYALDTRDVAEFDREFESPYNTYIVNGLPPGPISAPGRASLAAAAAPDETNFLFYVLSTLEGHHAFAETIEEHNANVAKAREDGVLG